MNSSSKVKAIEWKNNSLFLLDQRKLPNTEVYIECLTIDDAIEAIKTMVVRGAPAIGITAAYATVIGIKYHHNKLKELPDNSAYCIKKAVHADLARLADARPTAVNLMWAVEKMHTAFLTEPMSDDHLAYLTCLAIAIHEQDIFDNIKMGELACELMAEVNSAPFSVLTHCNAGSLATGGYGTALGVIRSAWKHQLIDLVYADETRPWLQGSRLTAWELAHDSIPVCLNSDGASGWLLANKNIKWIIVGADRIAANGDVANKIGTYNLAVLAKYHNVKMMVVAPTSTIDMKLASGNEIVIEMREGSELTTILDQKIAPEGVKCINPVFDITPSTLIDVIVTEKGLVTNPNTEKMNNLFV